MSVTHLVIVPLWEVRDKSLIEANVLECFSISSMMNVKWAALNGTVGYPVKIPLQDDREVLKSI